MLFLPRRQPTLGAGRGLNALHFTRPPSHTHFDASGASGATSAPALLLRTAGREQDHDPRAPRRAAPRVLRGPSSRRFATSRRAAASAGLSTASHGQAQKEGGAAASHGAAARGPAARSRSRNERLGGRTRAMPGGGPVSQRGNAPGGGARRGPAPTVAGHGRSRIPGSVQRRRLVRPDSPRCGGPAAREASRGTGWGGALCVVRRNAHGQALLPRRACLDLRESEFVVDRAGCVPPRSACLLSEPRWHCRAAPLRSPPPSSGLLVHHSVSLHPAPLSPQQPSPPKSRDVARVPRFPVAACAAMSGDSSTAASVAMAASAPGDALTVPLSVSRR